MLTTWYDRFGVRRGSNLLQMVKIEESQMSLVGRYDSVPFNPITLPVTCSECVPSRRLSTRLTRCSL